MACEFCEGDEFAWAEWSTGGPDLLVSVGHEDGHGTLVVSVAGKDGQPDDAQSSSFPISRCPFCGRDLHGD